MRAVVGILFFVALFCPLRGFPDGLNASSTRPWGNKNQPAMDSPVSKACAESGTTIVIGAGMAGLAAAKSLHDRGCEVVVLEARDRLGGRMWTAAEDSPFNGTELGAGWIHGEKNNPSVALVESMGLSRRIVGGDSQYEGGTEHLKIYQGSSDRWAKFGKEKKSQMLDLTENFWAEVDKEARRLRRRKLKDEYLRETYERIVQRKGYSEDELAFLDWHLQVVLGGDEGSGLDELSLHTWVKTYKEFDGPDSVIVEGYTALADKLGEGLRVEYNQEVVKVEERSSGIVVETEAGDTYMGARVIVTLPLGVLKESSITFEPPSLISQHRRLSIGALYMGLLDKLVLRFPDTTWLDAYPYGFVPGPANDKDMFCYMLNQGDVTDDPIVIFTVGGPEARAMEATTDDELVGEAMKLLRDVFGDKVPDPVASYVTRWSRDPYAYGSFSGLTKGSRLQDYDNLAQPSSHRVLWAGEATCRHYYGTVHGAYVSGLREASRILNERLPHSDMCG